jgi:hypothetical protein
MTKEKCAAAATGFQFFGLEYSNECYWGNSVNPMMGVLLMEAAIWVVGATWASFVADRTV